MSIGVPESTYIRGVKITAFVEVKSAVRRVTPGDTATHEARHIVAAERNGTSVRSATIVPGPGYLGLTELSRPDAIAAVAPHATGSNGTSHDVMMVHLMGENINTASKVAKSIIAENHQEVVEVATVLEEKKTIGPFEITRAMRHADTDKKGEKTGVLYIKSSNGQERKFSQLVIKNGAIVFPGEWISDSDDRVKKENKPPVAA